MGGMHQPTPGLTATQRIGSGKQTDILPEYRKNVEYAQKQLDAGAPIPEGIMFTGETPTSQQYWQGQLSVAQNALADAQKKASREKRTLPSQPPSAAPSALQPRRTTQRKRTAGSTPILTGALGESGTGKKTLLGG